MNKILVIGAHYDDAELGVGGAMAKWVNEKKEVFKITLSDNVTTFSQKNLYVEHKKSKQESANACKVLGVKEISNFPVQVCTELEFQKKQMQLIEKIIIENCIDTVVFHNLFDVQQDHVHASTISYVAGRYCKNLLMYQSNKYILPMDFYPRFFVDVTEFINLKKEALNCYSTEHNRNNQLFSSTISQNKTWGYQCRMDEADTYAEAFQVMKLSS